MRKYFFAKGNQKNGPFSFVELKDKDINKETLIWYEGLEGWTQASKLPELKTILELKPPLITKEVIQNNLPPIESSETISFDNNNNNSAKQEMFSKPFSFNGRIRRTEYGISFIIYFILYIFVLGIVESGEVPILGLAIIPMLWFFWAQGSKRCHDIGHSGWYQIIPFYIFWMFFANGENKTNKYGVNPKQ